MFETWLHRGWFDEIFASRLLVGHTHAAIDQVPVALCSRFMCAVAWLQMFHTTRRCIRKNDMTDVVALINAVRSGYLTQETRPSFVVVNCVLDFDSWFGPHLNGKLTGIRTPHGFHFTRDPETGRAGFRYKLYPGNKKTPWLGKGGKPDAPLHHMLLSVPEGSPRMLKPEWPEEFGTAIRWDPLESTCRHASLSIL